MSNDKKIVRLERGEAMKEIPDFYINNVKILGSLYEFMFTFGLKSDPKKESENVAIIRMSPQHAKVLAKILTKNVELYEKDIGEIKLPENMVKELGI
ncbi:MAG: DUF3467 domain-containing protein [Deltaproteobacteria bacterium]